MKNRIPALLFLVLIAFPFLPTTLQAQNKEKESSLLNDQNLSATLQLLASPEFEGRETGTRGGKLAANYIASRMMQAGLSPWFKTGKGATQLSDYFQPFSLILYTPAKAAIRISPGKGSKAALSMTPDGNYIIEDAYQSINGQYPLIFAGYGVHAPALGYDSYKGMTVKGKVVMIMEGYPGEGDTLGATWKAFRSHAKEGFLDFEKRLKVADSLGAVALIIIKNEKPKGEIPGEKKAKKYCGEDLLYQDNEYLLPGKKPEQSLPCYYLSSNASQMICKASGIDNLLKTELSKGGLPQSNQLAGQTVDIGLKVTADTIIVVNVGGYLRGKDTTRTILVGAHYDHLGKRGTDIYFGSDDNASGTTGVLTLAGIFGGSGNIPPVNLAFANWTAEEKGLIGSEYFASQLASKPGIELYINMDMISRSAPDDIAGKIISIGTRPQDENLKDVAKNNDLALDESFTLDLWDVTGHTGSDYASFAAKGIPVMTFFSGFHDEYHTPCDTPDRADLRKMKNILRLVDGCINSIMQQK
ncbi:MAG: M28 family peptidase [Bacteroidetes bacterium]|nr:M28 family peptidase [Bacteroidota bacterium]